MLSRAHRSTGVCLMTAGLVVALAAVRADAGQRRRAAFAPCPGPSCYRPAPAPKAMAAALPAPYDAATFLAALNARRAQHGRPPLAWSPQLAAAAHSNNGAQARAGMGHHINPGYAQCAAQSASLGMAFNQWLASPAHAAILLGPGTVVGVAFSGGYATANVSR